MLRTERIDLVTVESSVSRISEGLLAVVKPSCPKGASTEATEPCTTRSVSGRWTTSS